MDLVNLAQTISEYLTRENAQAFIIGLILGVFLGVVVIRKPRYEISPNMLCSLSDTEQSNSKEWIFYNILKKDGKNYGIYCFYVNKKGFCKKFNHPCKYFKALAKI